MLEDVLAPVHRAGWPFIGGCIAAALVFAFFAEPLAWLALFAAAFCAYFFRDPRRVVPPRPGLVVSPGDGKVKAVERAAPPPELEMGNNPLIRVSIFLSILDVHINRIPIDGTVTGLVYRPGKFFNAALDKASTDNERQAIRLKTPDGRELALVQIAGLVARRILCHLSVGQAVRAGERFGLIRFGSRVDLYLPDGVAALVAPGQYMIGGETVIADLTSGEPARGGEVR